MAVLANERHELFAQEIAKGSSSREAYQVAGFKTTNDAATDANASRLLSTDKVRARITELQTAAAEDTKVTIAGITKRLLAIAAKGEAKDDAPMLSVARASLMDAAKLNGLAPDKVQFAGVLGVANSPDQAGMDELSQWAREALAIGGDASD